MECLSLVLITAEKSYELKFQIVKWKAFDQFDSQIKVKDEMSVQILLVTEGF